MRERRSARPRAATPRGPRTTTRAASVPRRRGYTAAMSASTTAGSKSVPEQRRNSATASETGSALRYERSVVIALNASATDDARDERDLIGEQSVWIAGAVPVLV